jgi:hypothetical protein
MLSAADAPFAAGPGSASPRLSEEESLALADRLMERALAHSSTSQGAPSEGAPRDATEDRSAQYVETIPPGDMQMMQPMQTPAPGQSPQPPGHQPHYPQAVPPGMFQRSADGYFPGSTDWQPFRLPNEVAAGPPQQSPVGMCCAKCGSGQSCPPLWALEQGAWVSHHSRPRGVNVTQNVSGGVALHTRSIHFDVTAGYMLNLVRYLGRDISNQDQFLEFGYKGLNDWSQTATRVGGFLTDGTNDFGELFSYFPSGVTGFNRSTRHEIHYESRFDTFELNLRLRPRGRKDRMVLHPSGRWRRQCQTGCFPSYLIGFRAFSIDEAFLFTGESLVIDGGGDSHPGTGRYLVHTHNNIIGFQIGGDLLWRECLWDWGISYKLGPLINFSDHKSRITTTGAGGGDPFTSQDLDISRSANNNGVAAFADIGLFASYRLRPNFIVRAGWDWMWVVGLALAPEQLNFDTNAADRINDNGVLFFQGFSARAELTW